MHVRTDRSPVSLRIIDWLVLEKSVMMTTFHLLHRHFTPAMICAWTLIHNLYVRRSHTQPQIERHSFGAHELGMWALFERINTLQIKVCGWFTVGNAVLHTKDIDFSVDIADTRIASDYCNQDHRSFNCCSSPRRDHCSNSDGGNRPFTRTRSLKSTLLNNVMRVASCCETLCL